MKHTKQFNGTVLTPGMLVITLQYTSSLFYNGVKEVAEAYMRIYGFDHKKLAAMPANFNNQAWG